MDRANALARVNGRILAAYSARTITALRDSLPLRLALPHLEPVLTLNLDKEIRKDTLVIRRAAAALAAGAPLDLADVHKLFAETQAIDQDFINRVNSFPVRVVIRYAEIEPLRTRRIECLAAVAYRTLAAWRKNPSVRAALRATYSQPDFERVASEVFDLYAREVRALCRSVRLPTLLEPLRESFAHNLLDVMTGVGLRLVREIAHDVYDIRQRPERGVRAASRIS